MKRYVFAAITLAVIISGSLFRYAKIRQGGDAIAVWAGGRLVSKQTQNSLEKRLLNIAEEMAIASGTHIPRVYILEEEAGINAFVAGYTPNNTILAITKGALENLTRDELQGVIGHEYSHVLTIKKRALISIAGYRNYNFVGRLNDCVIRVFDMQCILCSQLKTHNFLKNNRLKFRVSKTAKVDPVVQFNQRLRSLAVICVIVQAFVIILAIILFVVFH